MFTGTAGTANAATADAATAIQALGTANDFTVDVTTDATKISAANLANYRAVVFVQLRGRRAQPAAGSRAAGLRPGRRRLRRHRRDRQARGGRNAFFDTLIGLTGAARTTGAPRSARRTSSSSTASTRPRAATPRCGRATPTTTTPGRPTRRAQVHTVARVRFNALPDGTSVTNDAVTRFTGTTNTLQPQQRTRGVVVP